MVGEDDGRSDSFFSNIKDLFSSVDARLRTLALLPDPGRRCFTCTDVTASSCEGDWDLFSSSSSLDESLVDDSLVYFLFSLDFLYALVLCEDDKAYFLLLSTLFG